MVRTRFGLGASPAARLLVLVLVLALLGFACGGDDDGDAGAADDAASPTTDGTAGDAGGGDEPSPAEVLPLVPVDVSAQGFTMEAPESWTIIEDVAARDLAEVVEEVGTVPGLSRAQLEQLISAGLVLLAVDPAGVGSGFASNLNVLSLPAEGQTPSSLFDVTVEQFESFGEVVDAELRPFGDSQVAYISYEISSGATTVQGEQYTFFSTESVYVVTMSTDDQAAFEATFDAMAASFAFAADAEPLVVDAGGDDADGDPAAAPTTAPPTTTAPSPPTTTVPTTTTIAGGPPIFTHTGPGPSGTFDLPERVRVRFEGDDIQCAFTLGATGEFSPFISDLEDGFLRLVLVDPVVGPFQVEEIFGCDEGTIVFYGEPASAAEGVDPDGDGIYHVHAAGGSSEDFAVPAESVLEYTGRVGDVCSVTLRSPDQTRIFDDLGFYQLGDSAEPVPLRLEAESVVYVSETIGCDDGDVVVRAP